MNQKVNIENYLEGKQNFIGFLKRNFAHIVLALACFFFIFKEALGLAPTDFVLITFLASVGLTYSFTIYVCKTLRNLGKKVGKEHNLFKAALKYLSDAKNDIREINYLTPTFCKIKNKQALQEVKENILQSYSMTYELYASGYYEQHRDELENDQLECLKQLRAIKITTLTANQLLSETSGNGKIQKDPLYLGKDEKRDNRDSGIQIALSKIFLPIVFSYFSVTVFLTNSIWWGLIQTTIILLIGTMYHLEGETYVLTDLRGRYINKADLLIEFRNLFDKHYELFEEEEKKIKDFKESKQKQELLIIKDKPPENGLDISLPM